MVYVVQIPQRLNNSTGEWENTVDIGPAMEYGELKVCLTTPKALIHAPGPMVDHLKRIMAKFSDDDYLLGVGDQLAVCIAATVAASINMGRYKLLKWNKKLGRYFPIEVELYPRRDV